MLIMKSEKREKNGRNKIAKSRKNQNALKEGKYIYLGILEVDTIKQIEMKEKAAQRKLLEINLYSRNPIKGINTWACTPYKLFGIILKMNKEGNQTNGSEDKKGDDHTQSLTSER